MNKKDIKKFPEEEPDHYQTAFVCNHFYDEWWFGHYEKDKKAWCIRSRDNPEELEYNTLVTRWIPISRPAFMFDQEDGSLDDYICPKCHREHKDCKRAKCQSRG